VSARIAADDLGVSFLFDRQRRVVTPLLAGIRRRGAQTWGLRHVSFAIDPGEGVALLGPSGSGKTSLLRLIAGVYEPDEGTLAVQGRIASLLSIDAGVIGLLTGSENTHLLGVLGGLSRAQARFAVSAVREESRLGDAFERPVSSYSQGMRARLSYAVSQQVAPAIVLLDEVHEAFDHAFRAVVEEHAGGIRANGGIVIATGHDHDLLEQLCPRALLLREGAIVADGPFDEVRRAYLGPTF
jgi:ABC-type polysaccharide/polyol phosphate transport system ATPase subunit